MKSLNLKIGGAIVAFFSLLAILAPLLSPHDPTTLFSDSLKLPPFWASGANLNFFLGTDDVGRDLLSRLIYGAQVSIGIGFLVVLVSTFLGIGLGLWAGSKGGWVDTGIMRFMDIVLSLPSILLSIVVVAILGPSLINAVIAISIVSLPNFVRTVRATVLVEKQKDYVMASTAFGANWFRTYVIGVLPNCLGPVLVQSTFGFSDGILSAAALGFLGLGVQPPTPEWGTMLSDSRAYLESASWMVTLPGLCILIVVLGFNLLGDGLRDKFDPKSRGR